MIAKFISEHVNFSLFLQRKVFSSSQSLQDGHALCAALPSMFIAEPLVHNLGMISHVLQIYQAQ